jgi:hypothetical protein
VNLIYAEVKQIYELIKPLAVRRLNSSANNGKFRSIAFPLPVVFTILYINPHKVA